MAKKDISSDDPSAAPPARGRGHLLPVVALVAVAAFLLLWRLDRPLLWQDEAETANVAATLAEDGLRSLPTPWDGEHLVTQQSGRDALRLGGSGDGDGRLVWAWHPWPQHYLAAAGLRLAASEVGPGTDAVRTAAARLPFALLALATVPLVYGWRLRRDPWTVALAATAIYALSIAFVLYSRQCRYYALLLLGGVLVLWAYDAAVGRRGPARGSAQIGALGAALALVFYANPLSGLALAVGLGAHALVLDRSRLRLVLGAGALFALLAAPWLALVLVSAVRAPELGPMARLELLAGQVWRFQYTFLPLVLWPALAWIGWRASRSPRPGLGREVGLLGVLAATMLLLVSLQAPLGTARYLLPLWPLCAAVLAGLWSRLHDRSVLLGGVFLVVLVGTDLFASLPALPVALARPAQTSYDREAPLLDKLAYHGRAGMPLAGFLRRQSGPARGPVAATVGFVRGLERPPRVIAAGYGWESLHFYLGVPAVGPGLQRAARRRLGLPPIDPERIDLVVPRRGWPEPRIPPGADADFVTVDLGVPDDAYENLPDPTGARFAPSSLPSLRVRVREGLLPETGHGSMPDARTSTGGKSGSRKRSTTPINRKGTR